MQNVLSRFRKLVLRRKADRLLWPRPVGGALIALLRQSLQKVNDKTRRGEDIITQVALKFFQIKLILLSYVLALYLRDRCVRYICT